MSTSVRCMSIHFNFA